MKKLYVYRYAKTGKYYKFKEDDVSLENADKYVNCFPWTLVPPGRLYERVLYNNEVRKEKLLKIRKSQNENEK